MTFMTSDWKIEKLYLIALCDADGSCLLQFQHSIYNNLRLEFLCETWWLDIVS